MIRIGVLGLANIAKKAIIPAIQSLEDTFVLSGIASETEEKIKLIEQEYNVTSFATYQDLINELNIDAVYIPLPNSLHYKWVKKALEKGKHVLVEKSLACKLEQVIELNEIAEKNNLVLVENFQFRFHSQLQKLKELLPEIGKIRSIRSSFCFPPFSNKNNIRYQKELGGGALLDAGAYSIKLAQELLGVELMVDSAQLNYDGFEVDIWGAGTLIDKTKNIPFQFVFGFDHHYQCNVEIIGSLGKITTQRIFTAPPGYEATILIEKNQDRLIEKIPIQNHYINMLNYFYLCTLDQKLCGVEYEHNIKQATLLSNFYKSAHE